MSFAYLILGWLVLTSLGIAGIVALEPLSTRRSDSAASQPGRTKRTVRS